MKQKVFIEDTRVKIPATIQFLRNGYEDQSLKGANIDKDTIIFIDRFKPAIEKINTVLLSDEEAAGIMKEIRKVIDYSDMGKAFYDWIKRPKKSQLKLIDFEHPENNDFAVVNELVFGPENIGSFRPDINILINGLPLLFFRSEKSQ